MALQRNLLTHVCWWLREVAGITDFLNRAIASICWVYSSLNFVTKPTSLLSTLLQNAFNLKQWFIIYRFIAVSLQIIDLFAQTKQTHSNTLIHGAKMWNVRLFKQYTSHTNLHPTVLALFSYCTYSIFKLGHNLV